MSFFKQSAGKLICTIVLSSLLIFFLIPIVYQLQVPTCDHFAAADGTCSIQDQNLYPFMDPGYPGPIQYPPPRVAFYPLSYILLHGMPVMTAQTIPIENATGNNFYIFFIGYAALIVILAYLLFCTISFVIYKLRKKKKAYAASPKK